MTLAGMAPVISIVNLMQRGRERVDLVADALTGVAMGALAGLVLGVVLVVRRDARQRWIAVDVVDCLFSVGFLILRLLA